MTTKEYLRQAYRLNELIKSHADELAALRQLSNGLVSSTQERVSGGDPTGDTQTVNTLSKIIELEEKIQKEMNNLIDLQQDIHNSIANVKDQDEQLLLRYRYIEFLHWEEIAERMNFSTMQVNRIHGKALQHLQIKNML